MILYKFFRDCICFSLLLLLAACQKEEWPADSYDTSLPPAPRIRIEEELTREYNMLFKTSLYYDTVLTGHDVWFSSSRPYKSYQWRIIEDPSFMRSSPSFTLWFASGMKFTLQLIGENEASGKQATFDTLVQVVHVLEANRNPIIGRYQGIQYPENSSYTISVNCDTISLADHLFDFTMSGFPENCGYRYNLNSTGYRIGYKIIRLVNFTKGNNGNYIATGSDCGAPTGFAILSGDNASLTFSYKTLSVLPGGRIRENIKSFKGKKL